jgi:hypothetical protein
MGRSSIGPNIGTMKGSSRLGTGLDLGMIGAVKQCRLRGEKQCKDRIGAKIRDHLQSNPHRIMSRIPPRVVEESSL